MHVIGDVKFTGPVIAIADPKSSNDKNLSFVTESYEDWQDQVIEFMQKSSLIIFRPYDTPGVIWEFEQIMRLGFLQKTILYVFVSEKIKPEYIKKYTVFKEEILKITGIDIGLHDSKMPMTFFDENNVPWETNDYFDIPIFRKVFCQQAIMKSKVNVSWVKSN
jgi:hypothetical protein